MHETKITIYIIQCHCIFTIYELRMLIFSPRYHLYSPTLDEVLFETFWIFFRIGGGSCTLSFTPRANIISSRLCALICFISYKPKVVIGGEDRGVYANETPCQKFTLPTDLPAWRRISSIIVHNTKIRKDGLYNKTLKGTLEKRNVCEITVIKVWHLFAQSKFAQDLISLRTFHCYKRYPKKLQF